MYVVPENIHTHPSERIGNSWGVGGSQRPQNLRKCMKLDWNFQRGGGGLRKNPFHGGSTWGDTKGLHCKYPGELHTIPYNFVIRNCMELSSWLFFNSLGAADFVTYDHREVFFPTPFCQENVIIWKQTRHDRFGRPKPAKIKGFSSSISEASFVSIWSK